MINDNVYDLWTSIDEKLLSEQKDVKTFYLNPFYLSHNKVVNLYFMENKLNQKKVYFEFKDDILKDYDFEEINGLNIVKGVDEQVSNRELLCVELMDNNIEEAFYAFLSSVIRRIDVCITSNDSIEAFSKTIKEYKDFFNSPNKIKLSKDEEQGLYCELVFLENLINKYGENYLEYWCGPDKNKRDFVFKNNAVEVKSTSDQFENIVTISNENQLDLGNLDKLYLAVYVVENNPVGETLIDIGQRIFSKFLFEKNKKLFLLKLALLKVDLSKYVPNYKFQIQKTKFYNVDDEFPKITSAKVDSRVFAIKYKVNLKGVKSINEND